MSASTEFEIKVSGGNILLPKNLPDGIHRRVREIETPTVSNQEKVFVRIPVTELSINDPWFKNFHPNTETEKKFKERIKIAIEKCLKDFWRPKYAPSFNENGTGICYLPGKKPAVGKSKEWWTPTASSFLPECKSRLGTKTEYIAFLAVLIKELVASGWQVQNAWYAVCNDSKKLGHYWNSVNAKQDFEDTGYREICGFCDLENTCKLLAEDEEAGGFWFAGGYYNDCYGFNFPLAHLEHYYCRNYININLTGWLVLEKDPYTE